MTEPDNAMTDQTPWQDSIADVLAEPAVGYHRSYYPAGEIDASPVVITMQRVDQATYDQLASGDADYQPSVVPC